MKAAGLDRIHSGFETGSDLVLKKINKGVTAEQEIIAGKNVKAGGIELSVYFMPGVGGKELTAENAEGTSEVINAVNPDFLRIRTAFIKLGTGLYEDFLNGDMTLCSDDEKLTEIRTVIERAEGITTMLVSDHMINLLQGIKGSLKDDKDKMIAMIDDYLAMPEEEKKMYQAARRMAKVISPKQMPRLSPYDKKVLRQLIEAYPDPYEWEIKMNELAGRYI